MVTTALNPAKIALPQFADKKSAYNTKQENTTITHGMVTYSGGEAVRLLTFGVRTKGIFVLVIPCWIDLSVPARFTVSSTMLNP